MHILFIEIAYNKTYSLSDLNSVGLGGTEASVLRIVSRLSEHCTVTLAQSHRTEAEEEHSTLQYIPADAVWNLQISPPDAIVCINKINLLPRLHRLYPDAKKYVWSHLFSRRQRIRYKPWLRYMRATIICVSGYHRDHTHRVFNGGLLSRLGQRFFSIPQIPVCYIYNPINDDLSPDGQVIDNNKLVCFSSPHKGLQEILETFKNVREAIPEIRLYLSTPIYGSDAMDKVMDDPGTDQSNIVLLGSLPHKEIIEHVRKSLCVFYPQTTFRETFGLIYAEANAVGTPVLAFDIGAASETLCHSNPLMDCSDAKQVLETLQNWRENGRPPVKARPEFLLQNVVEEWLRLFGVKV